MTDIGDFFKTYDNQEVERQKAVAGKWSNEEAFVVFVLCLSFKMKELKIIWIADSKESVERKMITIQENKGVMN